MSNSSLTSNSSNNKTRADLTAERIISIILKEKLQPGDRLPTESELIQMLGVGRSSIREALRRLSSRNIVETRRGSGTFVSHKKGVPEDPLGLMFVDSSVTKQQLILDTSDVRIMLEPEIAALAALRISTQQKEKLTEYSAQVDAAICSGKDYSEEDIQFHSYIAECSCNCVLKNLIPIITTCISSCIVVEVEKYRQLALEEHKEILESICNHDPIGARIAMLAHLHTSRRAFGQLPMSSINDRFNKHDLDL